MNKKMAEEDIVALFETPEMVFKYFRNKDVQKIVIKIVFAWVINRFLELLFA